MAKTRVKQSLNEEFANCVLHREELEELAALLTRGNQGPKIQSDGYAFESVDDLCEHLGREGALILDMSSESPTVSIQTSKYSGKVSVTAYPSAQTPEGIACFHSVASVLKRAALKKAWYSGPAAAGVSWAMTIALSYVYLKAGNPYEKYAALGLAPVSFVMCIRSFLGTRKRTRFYGVSRRDRPSFWQRKRDDLIVSAMSGAMGFVLGIVSTLIFQGHK